MKIKSGYILLILLNCLTGSSQTNLKTNLVDPVIAKQITVAGVCLCQTALSDLKNLSDDLMKVDVEEMNITKNCMPQKTSFEYGNGYHSRKYPGMIFQKDSQNYISKIRLTRSFRGRLPDGKSIDLTDLSVRDLFKLYPIFKHQWKGRECSEFWHFSNDTIFFYVKVDNTKPRFPLDELSYYDKPIEAIDIVVSCYDLFNKSNNIKPHFSEPIFFIDDVRVSNIELKKYKPYEIASVNVIKDTNAIKLLGPQGQNGIVYIETKNFVKNKYWNYFKSKSADYLKAVPNAESDSSVAYIVNNRLLKSNFEGDLQAIGNKNFIELTVINKEQLFREYGVSDKAFGIIIKTSMPNKIDEMSK